MNDYKDLRSKGVKRCSKCKLIKPLREYHSDKSRHDKLNGLCKSCVAIKKLNYPEKNPGIYNTNKLKYTERAIEKRYGITQEVFKQMVTNQDNKCLICRKPDKKRLSIDHCHKTGKIRGLLCTSCNLGLGAFKDDIGYITRAAEYLRKSLGE